MSRRDQRVAYHLDPKGIRQVPDDEIKAILRGADDLIGSGGRSMLVKILKGSRAREVLDHQLDQSPVYGHYRDLSADEILARIDRVILDGYLQIVYAGRLPVLTYTRAGWDIERETYANELLGGFDKLLAAGPPPYDMTYLKDRDRSLILLLLDKVEASRDPRYIPLLQAWEQVDYKKVQHRIRQVILALNEQAALSA